MIGITDRTTTRTILATFEAVGSKPPKAVASAYERAEKLTEGAGRMSPVPGALEAAVTAAILAGREVASDPDVQTALTAQHLATNVMLPDAVAGAAMDVIREACLLELDNIVQTWGKAFDVAAQVMTAAHGRIGDLALDDTTGILAKGGDIAAVWSEAKIADRTLDTILGGWTSLMQLIRLPLNADQRTLRLAPLTAEQWRSLPHKAKPWDLVRASIALSLPTLDEYRLRTARLEKARADELVLSTPVDREREATKAWSKKVDEANRVAVV